MKIRTNFVSNSSSTSFCIGKNFMTEEQIGKFREWKNSALSEETCLGESTYYFSGDVDQDDYFSIKDALVEMGVDEKYIG